MNWTKGAAALVLAVPVFVTAEIFVTAGIAGAAGGFPAPTYPAPVAAASGHGLALCPNPQGLQPFTSSTVKLARQAAARYDRKSLETDLSNADRAWWLEVRRMWRSGHPGKGFFNYGRLVVLGAEPAAQSGFQVFMRPACGVTTLKRSLMVTIGPSRAGPGPHCDACDSHLFFVNRRGRPLIYYLY
jgi:hypothetical protein